MEPKWERIDIDFVVGVPKSREMYYFIWAVVERLTNSTNFNKMKIDYNAKQ